MTDEKATGTDAGRPEISRYLPASKKIPGCGVGLGAVGAAGQTAVSDGGWQQYRGLFGVHLPCRRGFFG